MKKIVYIVATLMFLAACSQDDDLLSNDDKNTSGCNISVSVSKNEALEIADKILGKHKGSRSESSEAPVFGYVLGDRPMRLKSAAKDTVAYVINYPDDGGFAVIATDGRRQPVLAFSESGRFSFENDNCKENFLDELPSYLSGTRKIGVDPGIADFETGEIVKPIIDIKLSQGSPWDKYVVAEHPGCPVGCTAVAAALVMIYAKDNLKYHGENYMFQSMVNGIKSGQKGRQGVKSDGATIGGFGPANPVLPDTASTITEYVMSYDSAVDKMAKMLYWIGYDVDMNYDTGGSASNLESMRFLCSNLGYKVSQKSKYSFPTVINLLKNDHIIFFSGKSTVGTGHAWVGDGLKKLLKREGEDDNEDDYFIHCDWGWNGECNGYYSGDVFSNSRRTYILSYYFAVKLENK